MRKLAVLTSLVFLFGISTFALATDGVVTEMSGNDIVKAGGAAANDGGDAVAVQNVLNGNSAFSGNELGVTNTSKSESTIIRNDPKDSYNTDKSTNDSTNTIGASGAFAGSASNVGGGSATVNSEFHVPEEVYTEVKGTPTTGSNNNKTNSDQSNSNNRYEVEVEDGDGNAATMKGDATVDSRDQSVDTDVSADAEESSIAAINTTGTITLDESLHVTVKDIGFAMQTNKTEGSVSHNQLKIDGPKADSKTQSGKTESGKADSGKADSGNTTSGNTESNAVSISGSSAGAAAVSVSKPAPPAEPVKENSLNDLLSLGDDEVVTSDPAPSAHADATAGSTSHSGSGSDAKGGNAQGGNALSGDADSGEAKGGNATGDTATATTTFATGTNDFGTGSFNGLGSFNVNSGVSSLQQSPVRINAVVGGSVAGK